MTPPKNKPALNPGEQTRRKSLTNILDRLETSLNEILDKMVNQENSENLVAIQLNLARGITEIKLLATKRTKPT